LSLIFFIFTRFSELGPAQEFQQAVSGGFNNLLAAAAAGGDLTPTISAISKSVEGMGGSSEKVGPYLEAMAGLMKIISPNPTEEQKNEIFEASSQSLAASIELIRSQPGMSNFDSDERLQSIPEIADFFKSLESMFKVAAHISIDPTSANGYYTSPDFGAQSAQFMSSLIQASQTAKTLPALTTSKESFSLTSKLSFTPISAATTTTTTTTARPQTCPDCEDEGGFLDAASLALKTDNPGEEGYCAAKRLILVELYLATRCCCA
jgi:hypothetical protein